MRVTRRARVRVRVSEGYSKVRVRARVRVSEGYSKPIMTKPEMHGHMPRILPGQGQG